MFDPTLSVDAAFRRIAAERPGHTAVVYLGEKLSYRKLDSNVERVARALGAQGVKAGERVIVFMPHCPQWVEAWLAIQRLGAIAVPVTHFYGPRDLEYIARDCGARTIFCMDTNFGYVDKVRHAVEIDRVVVSSIGDSLPVWKKVVGKLYSRIPEGRSPKEQKVTSFPDLLKTSGPSLPMLTTDPGAVAQILYTGGTTGLPKGVPMSGLNLMEALDSQRSASEALIPRGQDVVIQGAPLYHILGQTVGLGALFAGDTLVLLPKMNLDAVMDHIHRYKATTFFGTPTLYRMLLEHDRVDQYDLTSLIYSFSGGDKLPNEVARRWMRLVGRGISNGYGATETCGGVALSPSGEEVPTGTVGRLVPTRDILLIDSDTLEPDPEQRTGELLVSSKYMVRQYWNKPEETALSFIDIDGRRWYRTGDLMRKDDEGWLYFLDRSCDIIKHKGYRVAASKVESCLQEHPAVISACCVGIADDTVGERIKAFVVLKNDVKGVATQELMRWCKDNLASYEVPDYIEFRDMLPKSKVGKLLRRDLRDEERRKTA
ncbi:MAG: class I adenylate-forming enzyme family protein [Thermoleophilia bacterium]